MSKAELLADEEKLAKIAPITAAPLRHHVFVCNGKSCLAVGSAEVKAAFERELEARNLRFGKISKGRNPQGSVVLTDCGSVGFCSIGAAVLVYPAGVWYALVKAEDVSEIVEKHLINGEIVERLALMNLPPTD